MSWNLSSGMQKGLLQKSGTYGSMAELLTNSTIDIFAGTRPAGGADETEGGIPILSITLNGDAFVGGVATNGINLGVMDGTTLKRAIDAVNDPALEVWKGAGLSDNTAGWARWYSNDKTTGASTTAVRMDGVVATSGGDLNMVNGTSIVTDVYSEVSDVSVTVAGV